VSRFVRPVLVRWRKRLCRCSEPACTTGTFSETHPVARCRAKLTARAISWATDALAHDDTTVPAVAWHLGVDWHTAWAAIKTEATRRSARPERTTGVRTLGVYEHIVRAQRTRSVALPGWSPTPLWSPAPSQRPGW